MARAGEIRVVDLAAALEMKVQAVPNQLQRLADQGFIEAKREGQNIFYRIKNPCLPGILEYGLCLLGATKERSKKRSGQRQTGKLGLDRKAMMKNLGHVRFGNRIN